METERAELPNARALQPGQDALVLAQCTVTRHPFLEEMKRARQRHALYVLWDSSSGAFRAARTTVR